MIKTQPLNHIDHPFSFYFGGPLIAHDDLVRRGVQATEVG